jgi:hypothetical protein
MENIPRLSLSSQELITNGTFQGNTSAWVTTGSFYANSTYTRYNAEVGYAYLSNTDGTAGNNLSGTVYQNITVPSNATSVSLSYWYNVGTFDTSGTAHDWLDVEIENTSGTVLAVPAIYSNLAATGTYAYKQGPYDSVPNR